MVNFSVVVFGSPVKSKRAVAFCNNLGGTTVLKSSLTESSVGDFLLQIHFLGVQFYEKDYRFGQYVKGY